ncbi:YdcF family protein [Anabaena subtropica]|uniref:YdcF family protein n=1 Tax=Anabaena subtropica FACHB-260 TaxID=2692884 RepID=A0ABR8CL55_9NOST|nr:YdcF family protein [Anabaena subtropica]MBD2343719.1 YdcF family protein [Anabaena subtropica FACHB-260]
MWLGYKEAKISYTQPQAVIVLGGSTRNLEREKFTAKFARQHPNLPIWISGGSPPLYTKKVFAKAGIDPRRLYLDYEAVDTVTNFTTLVDELESRGIKSVYLITSDFHMRRASVIGEIVLGSRGINFQPISVPSSQSPEPIEKSFRDGARALIWVATGYTGADEKYKRY